MNRDWTFYLQATVMSPESDAKTSDILRVENLTETEARAIKDLYRDDHAAVNFKTIEALAPRAVVEFIG